MNTNRPIIDAIIGRFHDQKKLAEKAIVQISDAQLHQPLDENTNSVAVIMQHVAGNLRSRFVDFLTSDGEKPDRDRDAEFVDTNKDRAALMAIWESGWECTFNSLATLSDDDLHRTITIRNQPHSVIDALLRALAHAGYHAGQIVQLSRYLAKENWNTITVPRGGSKQFNQHMREKFPGR
ncbi:MAG TPA: DUF1572 family protein [Tepidisphaeraceae bacterium]|jgi:uncharacterized damage-inducible protein DinB